MMVYEVGTKSERTSGANRRRSKAKPDEARGATLNGLWPGPVVFSCDSKAKVDSSHTRVSLPRSASRKRHRSPHNRRRRVFIAVFAHHCLLWCSAWCSLVSRMLSATIAPCLQVHRSLGVRSSAWQRTPSSCMRLPTSDGTIARRTTRGCVCVGLDLARIALSRSHLIPRLGARDQTDTLVTSMPLY